MKRFHFPLRAVAVLRRNREQSAVQALAAARLAHDEAEARRAQAVVRAGETAAAIAAGRGGPFRAGDQAVFLALHRRDCAAVGEAESRLAGARSELERRREECIEASRQMKIVTRLEERARATHRLAYLAFEQHQLDEAGAVKRKISR